MWYFGSTYEWGKFSPKRGKPQPLGFVSLRSGQGGSRERADGKHWQAVTWYVLLLAEKRMASIRCRKTEPLCYLK